MIEPRQWTADVLEKMKQQFGTRLLYLGLQGSYRRGEATETSDIDIVVLLDMVGPGDLDAYREIVRSMPEGEKGCGFFCGAGDFARWPRHEIFSFAQDTEDHFGKLAEFLPPVADGDIREAARIGASTLLHLLTHSYLYADADARPAILRDAYKSAFFVMLVTDYLKTGTFAASKTELLQRLKGEEKEIIQAGRDFAPWLASRSEKQAFAMLLDWSRHVLHALPPRA